MNVMVALGRQLVLALGLCTSLGCGYPLAADMFARPEVRDHLAFTSVLGREIHRRDKLTWWAAQCAHATLSPEQEQTVVGWVVDLDNPETDVLFFDSEGRVGLVVRCNGVGAETCVGEIPPSPMMLSERNQAQYRAVMAAWDHPSFEQTTEVYGPVVIPAGEGPDVDFWVYLVALNPNPDLLVLGQHYRFVVDASGRTVKSFRPFAEGKTEIDISPAGKPEGARVMSVGVSHFLDEVPTEMHAWAAINYGVGLVVMTESEKKRRSMPLLWQVAPTGEIAPFE